MPSVRVYVGLGANQEPEHHTRAALEHMSRQLDIVAVSTFYYTAAIGRPNQPQYLNGVALVKTEMSAYDVKFRVLRPVETALGRIRNRDPYAMRPIDLDILLYGDECICETQLIIPDPDLLRRPFLAAAVLELDSDIVHPGSGEKLSDKVRMEELKSLTVAEEFTKEIKERFARNE